MLRGHKGPAILSKQKLVFVVDDDPGMLKGIRRLLREHGYDSVLFASAGEFQKHDDFEQATCVVLDIHLNNESGRDFATGYLHDGQRQRCHAQGGDNIRMHRLSDEVVHGPIADRADRADVRRPLVGHINSRVDIL
jgi:CheY-like chemotaxis protein